MQTLNWQTANISSIPPLTCVSSPLHLHLILSLVSVVFKSSHELSLCWFVSVPPVSPEVVCSLWPLVCLQFCILLSVFFGLCFASLFSVCICVVQQPYNLYVFYLLFLPLTQLKGLQGTLRWL